MNLEEIITASVEKRVAEIVEKALSYRDDRYRGDDEQQPTSIETAVAKFIQNIAQEEVKKHDSAIRAAIIAAIKDTPTRFEVSAYSKIVVPKQP